MYLFLAFLRFLTSLDLKSAGVSFAGSSPAPGTTTNLTFTFKSIGQARESVLSAVVSWQSDQGMAYSQGSSLLSILRVKLPYTYLRHGQFHYQRVIPKDLLGRSAVHRQRAVGHLRPAEGRQDGPGSQSQVRTAMGTPAGGPHKLGRCGGSSGR